MAVAVAWCGRRSAIFGLVLFLLCLGLGLHTLIADFLGTKAEVHGIRTKVHTELGDMHIRIELTSDGHNLALERRRKPPQTPEVHNVAVGHDFTGNWM